MIGRFLNMSLSSGYFLVQPLVTFPYFYFFPCVTLLKLLRCFNEKSYFSTTQVLCYVAFIQSPLHQKTNRKCCKVMCPAGFMGSVHQPRALPFKGQVPEQTTVKWSIDYLHYLQNTVFTRLRFVPSLHFAPGLHSAVCILYPVKKLLALEEQKR